MAKTNINVDQIEMLEGLLRIYKSEVEAIHGIGITWTQLAEEAKDRCSEDFDEAITAREAYLEELLRLQDSDIKIDLFEKRLAYVDQLLFEHSKVLKEIYGLDVKAYLSIKKPRGFLK